MSFSLPANAPLLLAFGQHLEHGIKKPFRRLFVPIFLFFSLDIGFFQAGIADLSI